jgi:hypothetical protein
VFVINSHNFGGPAAFDPSVNGKMPIAAWIPTRTQSADDFFGVNNGTLVNGASIVADTGAGGTDAFDFVSASSQHVDIPGGSPFSFIQNTMVFSLSFWVKLASATARYSLCGNAASIGDKGFYVIFENGAGVGTKAIAVQASRGGFGVVRRGRSADDVITDTNWHHVGITSTSSGVFTFYVDGTASSTTYETSLGSLSVGDSSRSLNIGRVNHSASFLPMTGRIDDYRIFNVTLDATDVAALYAAQRGGQA